MSEIVVAIDADDVLYETAPASVAFFNDRYGNALTLDDMFKTPTVEKYGTDDMRIIMARVTEFTLAMADELPVIDGARQGVQGLLNIGCQLHLVTGRSRATREMTECAIERDFPGCFASMEFTDSLNPEEKRTKQQVCEQLGARAIVDDLIIPSLPVSTTGIVFGDYPWNQGSELPKGDVRCVDWTAVEREIERIANE